MNRIEKDSYEIISKKCAELMIEQIKTKPDCSFCLATGRSPLYAYRMFVQMAKEEALDVSKVVFIKLDEWSGLEMDDPATCEFFLQREIFRPLEIQPLQIISFNSASNNLENECVRIQNELDKTGCIDMSILGIGRNGHLGLNEPSDWLHAYAHVANLADKTKEHAMLKETNRAVQSGLTLGMADLMRSLYVVMMVTGKEKEEACSEMLYGGITTKNPATFLQLAHHVTILIEQD